MDNVPREWLHQQKNGRSEIYPTVVRMVTTRRRSQTTSSLASVRDSPVRQGYFIESMTPYRKPRYMPHEVRFFY